MCSSPEPTACRSRRSGSFASRRSQVRWSATPPSVAELDEIVFYESLREVVEHHLLVVDDAGGGYAFRHALAQDAFDEDMLPGERVKLHAAVGEALSGDSSLAGEDASAVPAALARHWYAAHDLPRALSASFEAARFASIGFAPARPSVSWSGCWSCGRGCPMPVRGPVCAWTRSCE